MARVPTSITPFRPTAGAFADRKAAATYREAHFPPTVAETPYAVFLNIEGQYAETGVLQEMILPVGQGIRAGTYQKFALGVITSDPSCIGFVSYLAKENQIPLLLADSVRDFSERAHPIGDVTQSEIETFELVRRLGGNITSAAFAAEADLEPAAASNRLSNLERKGYLFRISRSRREGDVYATPHIESRTASTEEDVLAVDSVQNDMQVPSDIRQSVAALAAKQGVPAEELLAQAWKDYFAQHAAELREELGAVQAMIRSDDEEGLLTYTTTDVESEAAKSVDGARQRRQQRISTL